MSGKKNDRSQARRRNRGKTGFFTDGKLGLETLEGRQLLAADVLGATSVAPPSGWQSPIGYDAYSNRTPLPAVGGVSEVAPLPIPVVAPNAASGAQMLEYALASYGTLTKKDPKIFLGG